MAKPNLGFFPGLVCKNSLGHNLMVVSCHKVLSLDTRIESHQGGRRSLGGIFASSTESQKKGIHGGWHFIYVTVNNFINAIFISCAGL